MVNPGPHLVDPNGAASRDALAVVGLGCRFPGAASAADFWTLLVGAGDAIQRVPADRRELATTLAGLTLPERAGGFLDGIDRFDPAFFRISPREAERLDPQQRLLLEVAWHALEDAGYLAPGFASAPAGVFIGLWSREYERRLLADPAAIDFYMTLGTGAYSASGRLSHFFGFDGPSVTVDTASSASLVAVHLACRSLRAGECELALAGGANLILEPATSLAYSRSGLLAADGRCKFGDARADGYVRAEGAGLVVLKRLARAIADGDRIYAVVRGSAVNHDGRSSDFLATPGRAGQETVIRRACADAGVRPGDLAYVEAHGTGSRAGDPIELAALGAVLAEGRDTGAPCRVGSVKSNIGHTEAAAGIAGFIKVALSLWHGTIPASLHVEEPNPDVDWTSLPLRLQRTASAWDDTGEPPLAGVSAIGIAGTNAHVVLQQWPADARGEALADRVQVLALSSHTPETLAALERDYIDWLGRDPSDSVADLCYTAGARRAHGRHRSAVVGATRAELRARLLETDAAPGSAVRRGVAGPHRRGAVFVFPGQGSQWIGMGRELYAQEPVFRAELDRLDAAIRSVQGWSVVDYLRDGPAADGVSAIDLVQPALFAMEAGLAALWRAWGLRPEAVVGHSMGEVAAAYVAGALSADDAARVIGRRSALLRRVSGRGAMAVVDLAMDDARAALAGHEDRVAVAVSNSRRSTVLSGDPAAIDAVVERLEARDVFCRLVKVDVASHSPQMDPLLDELRLAVAGITPRTPEVPMVSTLTGRWLSGAECDAEYWVRNLRQPVRFSAAIDRLLADGHRTFVEMSPHPLLVGAIQDLAREAGADDVLGVGSLRRDESERASLLGSVAELYVHGHAIDWVAMGGRGRVVSLPAYRWQRERYWYEPAAGIATASRTSGADAGAAPDIRARLLAAPPGRARRTAVEQWVREEIARVLRLPAARVDPTTPFRTLGLDSLMGQELRARLERMAGIVLPVTAIWNRPTVARLAPDLAERMGVSLDAPAPASAGDAGVLDALIDELEQLSDAEATRLLKEDA
jgi:acyl transferase domain-containing protein